MKTFDAFDRPDGWQTPADAFARDFANGARVQAAPWGGVAILGHADLVALSRDPAADGMAPDLTAMPETPALHRLLAKALFPRSGNPHRSGRAASVAAFNAVPLAAIVEEAVTRALSRRLTGSDLRADPAAPIVRDVWGAILGLGADEARRLAGLVRDLGYVISTSPQPDKAGFSEAAATEMRELSLRAADGDPPFVRTLRELVGAAEAADLIAGMGMDAIKGAAVGVDAALRVAFQHRDRIAGTAACANECLRLAGPTPMTMRLATAPIEAAGYRIDEGTVLSMIWAAGNHDPRVFHDPAQFDPSRTARPLSFGMGQHACLGHAVVRGILVNLLGRLDHVRPAGPLPQERWRPMAPDWLTPVTLA